MSSRPSTSLSVWFWCRMLYSAAGSFTLCCRKFYSLMWKVLLSNAGSFTVMHEVFILMQEVLLSHAGILLSDAGGFTLWCRKLYSLYLIQKFLLWRREFDSLSLSLMQVHFLMQKVWLSDAGSFTVNLIQKCLLWALLSLSCKKFTSRCRNFDSDAGSLTLWIWCREFDSLIQEVWLSDAGSLLSDCSDAGNGTPVTPTLWFRCWRRGGQLWPRGSWRTSWTSWCCRGYCKRWRTGTLSPTPCPYTPGCTPGFHLWVSHSCWWCWCWTHCRPF